MTRKRISRTKLGITIAGMVVLFLAGGVILLPYLVNYFVTPERLIRDTTRAIENLTGADIEIGQAKLSMLEGVTFREVRMRVPEKKRELEPGFEAEDALLLQAETFQVKLRREGLLGLKFGLDAITVEKPEFHLARLAPTQKWNWQMLFTGPATGPAKRRSFGIGPPITLKDGKIVLTEIHDRQRTSLGTVCFAAQAKPQNNRAFYRIELKTWTDQAQGPNLLLDFNSRTSEVLSGHIETVALKNIEHTLPEPCKSWWQKLHLTGKVTVSEIRYKPESSTRLVLTLDNVRAKVPLSGEEFDSPSETALFNLSELTGQAILDGSELIIPELKGKLNGVPCLISGRLQTCVTDPKNAAFDLRIACEGFTCPEYTDPAVGNYMDTMIPWQLRNFFHNYKPIGRVDCDLSFRRTPGREPELILSGQIVPRGCSAEYFKFPYRVDDITGLVRVVDSRFELVNITGSTGRGSVVVNGTVSEPSKYAEVTLRIDSTRTPLDEKLYLALPDRYKTIFSQFNPAGFADTHIELYNPRGMNQPWKTDITARLFETSALYEKFRYPARDIQGELAFHGDKLELKNITGRHESAEFTLDGTVEHFKTPNPEVRLNIAAKNVPIDNDLVEALPPATGRIVRDCRLTGKTHIEGSLTRLPDSPLDYSFQCRLENAGLTHKDFPYPVENTNGRLIITPKTVVIDKIHSEKGEQTFSASGRVSFNGKENDIALAFTAKRLPIDKKLYDALKPDQRNVWNQLNPTGSVDVRAALNCKPDKPWDWTIDLAPQNAAIRYKTVAPLSKLQGKIVFTPSRTELKDITGQLDGKSPVCLTGVIHCDAKTIRLDLAGLTAENIRIDDGFLQSIVTPAVAERFKWTSGGSASCSLKDVRAEFMPDKTQKWQFQGRMDFQDVKMAIFDEEPAGLKYTGQIAWVTPANQFALNGSLDLKSLNWNGRRVENVHANLAKPLDSVTLNVDSLRGRYAEGQISGIAKMKFLDKSTRYGIQLTLDNLDAATAMNLNSRKKSIHGKMKGEIYLQGAIGQKYSQLGGGVLQITGAEVFKVPLMARIYENLRHEPPNLASFHDITARFALEKYKVKFEHVELTGPTISLVGSGDLNISNDRINLDLVAATPKKLKNLPVLPELMQGAAREISQIEIHGPTSNPTITAHPLKDISDTLKTFFDGKTVH